MNTVYGLDYYQNVRYGLVTDNGRHRHRARARRARVGAELLAARHGVQLRGRLGRVVRPCRELLEHGDQSARRRVARDDRHRRRARADRGPVPAVRAEGSVLLRARRSYLESTQFNVYIGDSASRKRSCARPRSSSPSGASCRRGASTGSACAPPGASSICASAIRRFISEEDFRRGEFFGRFSVDTMDSVSFPREGSSASLEWRVSRQRPLEADADFDQLLARGSYAKTWGRHTVLTTLRYDATISGRRPTAGCSAWAGSSTSRA